MAEISQRDWIGKTQQLAIGWGINDTGITYTRDASNIKRRIAAAKIKAVGENRTGIKMYKADAAESAKILQPLFVKQYETSWITTQSSGRDTYCLARNLVATILLLKGTGTISSLTASPNSSVAPSKFV